MQNHFIHPQGICETKETVATESTKLSVENCELLSLPVFSDNRGDLLVAEFNALPFKPKRSFFVFKTPNDAVRGEHAHKKCHQFIVALNGFVKVIIDDGLISQEVMLGKASHGLYVPPGIWATERDFSPNTVLNVLASHEYEEDDYIRDYSQFKEYKEYISSGRSK